MITIRDIHQAHPFGISSPTDTDYARIANSVMIILRTTPFCAHRTEEEVKRMTLKVTLYFEDLVSE